MPTTNYAVAGNTEAGASVGISARTVNGFHVSLRLNTTGAATDDIDFSVAVNATNATLPETITTDQFNSAFNAPTFRNILINGNLTINQRNVNITSASTGDYGEDRWKKTAGGMTQIVEDGNYVPSSSYTLSGTGITTTTATSPASGDWDISTTFGDISVTARSIQLEYGNVASAFDLRPVGVELSLCQRYFYTFSTGWFSPYWHGYDLSCFRGGMSYLLPTEMRTQPTSAASGFNWVSDAGVSLINSYGGTPAISGNSSRVTAFVQTTSQTPAGVQGQCLFDVKLDAEL